MNRIKKLMGLGLFVVSCGSVPVTAQNVDKAIYKDAAYTADERATDLLNRLTLEEKVMLMWNDSPAIPRLDIPAYNWWNEALHGVARAGVATVFPQTIGMAATFDPEAVRTTFDMVSTEQRAKYNESLQLGKRSQYSGLTVWTPNINIFRDPRWGRGMETYGEDPYLTSVMGSAVVNGLQGGDGDKKYDKLHACAKHFAVHSGPEWNRHEFNAENIDKRDLWETYLPAFKALVCEAGVKEVMCAYNRFEGEPCCGSKTLLKKILRDDWGYDNVIVSDCGAITDFYREGTHMTHPDEKSAAADAVLSGNDLECFGGAYRSLADAVAAGLIDEADIDVSVHRLLKARFELGNLYDDELTPWAAISPDTIGAPAHRAQALDMARKSMTLLKNDNVLPLSNDIRSIAVVGPNANDSVMMWANYNGVPKSTVTILQGLRNRFPDAEIIYEKGCNLVDNKFQGNSEFDCITSDGKNGMTGSFWSNKTFDGEPMATARYSTPLNFSAQGETAFAPNVPFYNFSARFEGTYIPKTSGKKTFFISSDDGFRLIINGKEAFSTWREGVFKSNAIDLDVVAGERYDIVLEYFQAEGGALLTFDVGEVGTYNPEEVLNNVRNADVIVFVGGLSPELEGEEMDVEYTGFRKGDRTAIEIPAIQTEMMRLLKSTGKPVVFVLCAGSAVAIPWEAANCDAIIDAFYPGEAGGTAVAEVIAGDVNPAGRLPITFYSSTNELPDFEDYSMKGRTYRFYKGKPLYPFGYGLSYTTFEYGKSRLSTVNPAAEAVCVEVVVPVRNIGRRDGEEVVQLYVRNTSDVDGPLKSLKNFRRVPVKAGEEKLVTFRLFSDAFEQFNPESGRMEVKPGEYEILYGGSSDDAALSRVALQIK